ncbi:Protein EFR3 [Cladobotryum mycophilum]|uniref:Protein EFR3 n=1 Tax=Cladobotryum mycophilum TaxID=491253 RepID=A0ABR0T4J6_9HYPO
MNAIQQKCRPKHQVLVLKCYPRTTKGAVDVKPNSSELSYLLYYATSRRSKIQKIGAFLEKKTASDVWRMRIGNVQVTLGILAALVEKSPKDAVLIAPCILKILDLILRSGDITMIESSLPTWEAFCEHHDASSLFADQSYLNHYESIVRSYAKLASTRNVPSKGTASRPIQMRWRNAGLSAIRYIATSDALATPSGRQIDTIVPMILENLWTEETRMVDVLLQRVEMEEKVDTEKLLRRRTSIATVRTSETGGDANPLAISGTAMDVDKMAEEDTGVLAMQCLKSIFVVPNRSQIYTATGALLKFIAERVTHGDKAVVQNERGENAGWAIKMYSIIARWAPVQDRYVILVSALDTLTHTSMRDDNLGQHMALTAMIESLLRSDINLIGLSVMDVLLGLIKQIRKLFQLSNIGSRAETPNDEKTDSDREQGTRGQRKELLVRLEQCIGDLASHIYYADQISDMIAAILGRLKPSQSSAISTPQGEKTDGNEHPGPGASVVDLAESQTSYTDAYFAYNAGRISALRVVKGILHVANPKTKLSTNMDLGRNRVPTSVWEGTQWLLRDPEGSVRKAYVDALMTWLDLETTSADLVARDEVFDFHRSSVKGSREPPNGRRAVSSASNRERQTKARRSQFLPQLHLAIYDNALQFVDFDNDLTMLHSLLTKLVFKLGVNAVRYGVPMVYRLQEEVMEVELPIHKVRVAALCHGYFWALTYKFEFETSAVGRAINNEIGRRRSKGFWVEGINIPAPSIDQIGMPGQVRPQPAWDLNALETEELLPFDDRNSLIQCVATGYEERSLSPPGSPVVSPGRAHPGPMLGASMGSVPATERPSALPSFFREQMTVEWSRDEVMAALAAEGKTESINGSRAGTVATGLRGLTISTAGLNGHGNGHLPVSPFGSQHNLRPHSSQAYGEREHLGPVFKYRQASIRSGISPPLSASSRAGVTSVEQLKRVLSGTATPHTPGFGGSEDDSGDSMVSYYSPSEKSFSPTTDPDRPSTSGGPLKRSMSGSPGGPLSSNPPHEAGPKLDEDSDEHDIPPVPALPHLGALSDKGSIGGGISIHDYAFKGSRRNLVSRGGESTAARSFISRDEGSRGVDLQELLRGIDSRPGEGSLGNLTKPPY